METPKKQVKKTDTKDTATDKPDEQSTDMPAKKKVIDDEDDEDFDMPLDDIGRYESFEGYDEDDDF